MMSIELKTGNFLLTVTQPCLEARLAKREAMLVVGHALKFIDWGWFSNAHPR